jgi:hypothetical protein
MNERIRELARESGLVQYDTDSKMQDAERFAELIVRECVLISRTSTDGFSAGRRMEQHFGVGE